MKQAIEILITCAVLFVVGYLIGLKREVNNPIPKSVITKIDSIEKKNDSLKACILTQQKIDSAYQVKVDSLTKLKQNVVYVYLKEKSKIDSASNRATFILLKNILANSSRSK